MNKLDLFKKMLPGLLPLFIFIIADEIWGTQIGLIVAVVVGNVQLIYIWFREKRLDRFVLFDTLLIVSLGLVSIALDNDIFFKLKPALIGIILCTLLAISAFSRKNLILVMSQRYMKNVPVGDEHIRMFNRSLRIMFWLFLVHTLLVMYSAFYMSKETWAFISGGLFYIIFGVYFVYELVRTKLLNRNKVKSIEWLPVIDESGKITGKATREACHQGNKILHPVIHLHIINRSKQIYLQKRPDTKDVQPGKWDTAVGGHVSFNETIEKALMREAMEELGVNIKDVKSLSSYKWETDIEAELVYTFVASYNNQIIYNKDEVSDGRFWSITEIKGKLGQGIFTPNFELEFEILKKFMGLVR